MDLIETFEELEPQLDEYQRKQLSEHLERATEAFQQFKSRRATSPGVGSGSSPSKRSSLLFRGPAREPACCKCAIFPESAGPMSFMMVFSHHGLADIFRDPCAEVPPESSVQRIDENQLLMLLIAFDQRAIVTRAGFCLTGFDNGRMQRVCSRITSEAG